MSRYTPEEIAAAQAAIRKQPDDAQVVTAPYDVSDGRGHLIVKGTPVWSYAGGHPGGPGDPAYNGPNAGFTVEYSYTCLACAKTLGWVEPAEPEPEPAPEPKPVARTTIEEAVLAIGLEAMRGLQWSANMLNHRQFCAALGWPEDDYSRNKFKEFQALGRLHVFDDTVLEIFVSMGMQKAYTNSGPQHGE